MAHWLIGTLKWLFKAPVDRKADVAESAIAADGLSIMLVPKQLDLDASRQESQATVGRSSEDFGIMVHSSDVNTAPIS